jgi:hypothetical protein
MYVSQHSGKKHTQNQRSLSYDGVACANRGGTNDGDGYVALSAEFGFSSARMIGNGRLTTGIFVGNYTTDVLDFQR